MIDKTFTQQVSDNATIFDDFPATRGAVPDPAARRARPARSDATPTSRATYKRIAAPDPDALLPRRDRRATSSRPSSTRRCAPDSDRAPVRPGDDDAARPRRATTRRAAKPTGSATAASTSSAWARRRRGGSTVGEALNILEGFPRNESRDQACTTTSRRPSSPTRTATSTSATRTSWTCRCAACCPTRSPATRRSLITDTALPSPAAARRPVEVQRRRPRRRRPRPAGDEGQSTTHLTVADRWGNVVSYTFTIEQTGGSGMVVPGRGFLLNNELTDFNFADAARRTRRRRASGRARASRRRSSSTTAARGRARLAGRRHDHHDRAADPGERDRLRAVAAGRAGGAARLAAQQRHDAGRAGVHRAGRRGAHGPRPQFTRGDADPPAEIGAATGIRFLPGGRQQAAAEPTRRGGGSAMVVRPG